MALSNWDTMAFGPDGKPCNGVLKAIDGKGWIEIYKNWVYFHNEDMWCEDGSFMKDTIAEIWSGIITMDRFEIHAARGQRQQAIFVLAYTWKYGKTYKDTILKAMAGVGCYGWGDELPKYLKKFKIDKSKYKDFYTGTSYHDKKSFHSLSCIKEDDTMETFEIEKVDGDEELEPDFIGVTYETQEEFFDWLKEEIENNVTIYDRELKEWYDKIQENRSSSLRFNQGDQYFAKHLGFDTPATKVGEQKETILTGTLRGIGKKN